MIQPSPSDKARPVRGWVHSGIGMALSGVTLNVCSFLLVLYAATEEPFFIFSGFDLIFFFALGPALIAGIGAWSFSCVTTLASKGRRWLVLIVPIVLWEALNLIYLAFSVYGYWTDMTHPSIGPWS